MRYLKFDMFFAWLLAIGIMFSIVAFPYGLTVLGVVGLYFIIKYCHRSILENKIKKLPKSSLPTFYLLDSNGQITSTDNTRIY